jgi:hypothetical protein
VRRRVGGLSAMAALGCLAFAGSASAGIESFSGTVANGSCVVARTIFVPGPSRIEVSLSTTAQNPTDGRAELVASNGGRTVGSGPNVSYDAPGSGQYVVRVCVTQEEQNPPQVQFNGLLGTGPAGKPVLTSDASQTPSATAPKYLGPHVVGKAAIKTSAGLAWFTMTTAGNSTVTLRVFDPKHHVTRVVKGLKAAYAQNRLSITGHGVKLVLVQQQVGKVTFTSSTFKASGKVVRGGFQITA